MSGKTKYKGEDIYYQSHGKGPALVLLHGFMENQGMWDKMAGKLKEHFRVITVDLPGHGKSGSVSSIHTMDMMAIAVNKVLRELDVKHCVMIGHSMGGYVTLAYARKYPGKLKGIGLFHSHASDDNPEQKVNRNRMIEIVEQDKLGFIRNFFPDLFSPSNVEKYRDEIEDFIDDAKKMDKNGITAALEGMKLRLNSVDVLTYSRYPVLFIIGKQDSRIPAQKILDQAILPSYSEVHVLDYVGHMGFIEARKETTNAILHFAQKIYQR
jgi:pimeloyl-ACP methyl ester carboxylesterase